MDYGRLPFTGAGVVVGGIAVGYQWLALLAAALIVLGAVAIRVGWRPGKAVNEA